MLNRSKQKNYIERKPKSIANLQPTSTKRNIVATKEDDEPLIPNQLQPVETQSSVQPLISSTPNP